MNQDDFRKFLEGKPQLKREKKEEKKKKKEVSSVKKEDFLPKKVKERKNAAVDEDVNLTPKIQYRDRARERREGKNLDYKDSDHIISILNKNSNQIEASKYLEGSQEHTHLVKGLDYTLLRKNKEGLKNLENNANDEEEDDELEIEDPKQLKFKSKKNQEVFNLAYNFDENDSNFLKTENEFFFPGRMCFEFDLQGNNPVKRILRNKIQMKDSEIVDDTADKLVIDKIISVFENLKTKKENFLQEKKNKKNPFENNLLDNHVKQYEDVDIFADVGRDYELSKPSAEKEVAKIKSDSYFDSMDIEEEEKKIDLKETFNQAGISGDLFVSNPAVLGKGVKRTRRIQEDTYGYGEEYGESFGFNDDEEDELEEEEEEAVALVDQGTKKNRIKQKTRFDFETEEEFAAYKEKQIHLPKAAFNFGVKVKDGRKNVTSGKSGKKIDTKDKQNNEFQKISKMMEGKYGKGLIEKKPTISKPSKEKKLRRAD